MGLHSGVEGVDKSREFDGTYNEADLSNTGIFLAKNS